MSTKTYNFLEALRALTEGRCKGIKSQYSSTSEMVLSEAGQICWGKIFTTPIPASPSQQWLLGQWTLVDEKREPVPWSKPEHVPGPICWLNIGSNDLLIIRSDATGNQSWRMGVNMVGAKHAEGAILYRSGKMERLHS